MLGAAKIGTARCKIYRRGRLCRRYPQLLCKALEYVVLDRKEQLRRLGMSVDELPNLWLFQNSAGQPMDGSRIRKVFAKLLAKAGLAQREPPFLASHFRIAAPSAGRVAQICPGTAWA